MSVIKKALLVGINYNSNPQIKLNGCINDIVNVSDVLNKHFHYDKTNIKELRDDSNDPQLLPTRANILGNLIRLVNESANLSEIWFHYSGHGSQIFDITNTIKEGIEEVIIPVDYENAGFIVDWEIFNILKNAKCKVMLIFDCCHSGSVCDLQWMFDYKNGSIIKYQIDDKEIANPDIFCFSGCKDSQTSADTFCQEEKISCGAFTDAFIHCLKNNNYNVSILKLYVDIYTLIKKQGYMQTPTMSSSSQSPNYIFSENLVLKDNIQNIPISDGGWATAANRNFLSNIISSSAPSSMPTLSPTVTVSFSLKKPNKPISSMNISSILQHIDTKVEVNVTKTDINNLKNQMIPFLLGKKK